MNELWDEPEGRVEYIERPCEQIDEEYDNFRLLSTSNIPSHEGYGRLNDEPDSYDRKYASLDDTATRELELGCGIHDKDIEDLK